MKKPPIRLLTLACSILLLFLFVALSPMEAEAIYKEDDPCNTYQNTMKAYGYTTGGSILGSPKINADKTAVTASITKNSPAVRVTAALYSGNGRLLEVMTKEFKTLKYSSQTVTFEVDPTLGSYVKFFVSDPGTLVPLQEASATYNKCLVNLDLNGGRANNGTGYAYPFVCVYGGTYGSGIYPSEYYLTYKEVDYGGDIMLSPNIQKNPAECVGLRADSSGALPVPYLSGYDFLGWFTEKEGGEQVFADTIVPTDQIHTLYAHWKKQTPKQWVQFNDTLRANEEPVEKLYEVGSPYGELPVPALAQSWTFVGWYTEKNGQGEQITPESLVAESEAFYLPLYSHWKLKDIQVTFDPNGGNPLDKTTIYVSEFIKYGYPAETNAFPIPTHPDGKQFCGWYTAPQLGEGVTKVTEDTPVTNTDDHTLYAHWAGDTQLDPNNTIFLTPIRVEYGVTYYEKQILDGMYNIPSDVDRSSFTIQYFQKDDPSKLYDHPTDVGSYSIVLTRDADQKYAAYRRVFDGEYEYALHIQKAFRDVSGVYIYLLNPDGTRFEHMNVEKGDQMPYTYFSFELIRDEIPGLQPDAVLTYHLYLDEGESSWEEIFAKEPIADSTEPFFGNVPWSPGTPYEYVLSVDIPADENYYNDLKDVPVFFRYVNSNIASGAYILRALPSAGAEYEWYAKYDSTFDCSGNVIEITTAEQLSNLAHLTWHGKLDTTGKTFKLMNDIDLSGRWWTPIGSPSNPFKGVFDGQGHTISGMLVKTDALTYGTTYKGLFGYVTGSGAVIRNLVVEDSIISFCDQYVGGVVGYLGSGATVENCVSYAMSDSSGVDIGGVVGYANKAAIRNCAFYGTAKGAQRVGGIVGCAVETQVLNCESSGIVVATGNIQGTDASAGGVAGQISEGTTVYNCSNYSSVTSNLNHIGGIVGWNLGGHIYNCMNLGDVCGTSLMGADAVYDPAAIGGIVGENADSSSCRVENCYTAGNVHVNQGQIKYMGAVVGRNYDNTGYVLNCYYLAGSCKDPTGPRNALGTEKGSLADTETKNGHYNCASFSVSESVLAHQASLSRNTMGGSGETLYSNLYNWVMGKGTSEYMQWAVNGDGFPYLVYSGRPTSSHVGRR